MPTSQVVNRDQVTDVIQRGVKQSTIDCYFFFAPLANYDKRSLVLPDDYRGHSTIARHSVNGGVAGAKEWRNGERGEGMREWEATEWGQEGGCGAVFVPEGNTFPNSPAVPP
jgi:hypothetical protein